MFAVRNLSLLLALALLGFATPARAGSGSIAGTVTSAAGPIANTQVKLVDLRRATKTDSSGAFSFADVPPGSYLLAVDDEGKGEGIARVSVVSGQSARVDLEVELVHHADELVVTGGLVRSRQELAQPITVLHGEDLAFRSTSSLGETLAQQPGISSTGFGQGASRPVIRGLGGDRVRMLQDGLDVGDVSSTSPDHAVTSEPGLAERIEVLRGPATLLYGSSAIGGAVNVIEGRIPEVSPGEAVGGSLEIGGSTVDGGKRAFANLNGGNDSWAWHVDGLWRETDEYEFPGEAEVHHEDEGEEHEEEEPITGELPNSDLETRTVTLGASRFLGQGNGYVGLSVSRYETEYGIPGGAHGHEGEEGEEEEEEEGGVRIDMERQRFDLRAENLFDASFFQGYRARLGVVDYEHAEVEGSGEIGTLFFNDSVEGRFELLQRSRTDVSGTVGVQVQQKEIEAIGEEAFIPFTRTRSLAIFSFHEVSRVEGRLRFQLGGRFENAEVEARPEELRDRSFDGLSGSLGLLFLPSDSYAIAFSVARSVKLPNAEELFSDGPHIATGSFELGDEDLGKEESIGLDLALRKTSGRVRGELSFFLNQFDDFIFQSFTGDEEDGLPVLLYTQGDADFWGAELEVEIEAWHSGDRHLDLSLQGDVVRAELDGGANLPRIPPSRLGFGIHYHDATWHVFAEAFDVDSQDRLAENETETDGYTMVNAGLSYRFIVGAHVYDLALRGRNLTDEEARNHVSFLKDTVPLPGRDFGLSLRFSF